jgi:hypothetical protein
LVITEQGATDAIHIAVTDDAGKLVFETRAASAPRAVVTVDARLPPGLYHVVVDSRRDVARGGFWVRQAELLAAGPRITAGTDWLRKDGQAFPIVGTTYMASDVHRDFLFEPNPDAWDLDFAEMKRRGMNFVRTGLWTGWARAASGGTTTPAVDESVLAALEAYVMTAAKHGVVVCFNLFAFLPPSFGGDNPYLDPRSVAAQKAFVTSIARRFRDVPWIHWDLINEPSYAPLPMLWRTRPVGDAHEAALWRTWVRDRHGDGVGRLRALWRVPEDDVFTLPRDEDFGQAAVQIDRRPRRARDFREFAEDMVARWAGAMREAIRAGAGEGALVTLGQDEGGIYERATQQLMAPSLDYTAVHTWWKNDDLLWDGVLTKVIGKPNLHQETGLMRLEDIDGAPWRSADDAARLLERKLGYAFAARGAGVVEWVWNINPFMPLDEEVTIGLFRPDGTAKPELDTLQRFAQFFERAQASRTLGDFEPDPVLLVIPHARAFLGMTGGMDATKHVVRVLGERFGVVPAAVSDLRLTSASLRGRKLAIVASATVIDEGAARALRDAAQAGTKVLITGAIEGDSYGRQVPALQALGVMGQGRPVTMHERSGWSSTGWVTFEGLLQESARRATSTTLRQTLPGNVWHEPLPLELARDREPLAKLLGAALAAANVAVSPHGGGVTGRVLLAPRSALLVAVNERPEPAMRRLGVDGHWIDLHVPALGVAMMLVARRSGDVLATLSEAEAR